MTSEIPRCCHRVSLKMQSIADMVTLKSPLSLPGAASCAAIEPRDDPGDTRGKGRAGGGSNWDAGVSSFGRCETDRPRLMRGSSVHQIQLCRGHASSLSPAAIQAGTNPFFSPSCCSQYDDPIFIPWGAPYSLCPCRNRAAMPACRTLQTAQFGHLRTRAV